MTKLELTHLGLRSGIWNGHITGAATEPEVTVLHNGEQLSGVSFERSDIETVWLMRVAVPWDAITDGVQFFFIHDATTDEKLGQFFVASGDLDVDDMRAEVSLLRAELDMLKRAFRRHCSETEGS